MIEVVILVTNVDLVNLHLNASKEIPNHLEGCGWGHRNRFLVWIILLDQSVILGLFSFFFALLLLFFPVLLIFFFGFFAFGYQFLIFLLDGLFFSFFFLVHLFEHFPHISIGIIHIICCMIEVIRVLGDAADVGPHNKVDVINLKFERL